MCERPIVLRRGTFDETIVGCGKCRHCKKAHRNMWLLRMKHELAYTPCASFITLTYSSEYLPMDGYLLYKDFQDFMKRFRRSMRVKVKYFCVGEYGEQHDRPHWHAILLGWEPPGDDLLQVGFKNNRKIFASKRLAQLWPLGFNTISSVGEWTLPYMFKYLMKPAPNPQLKGFKHMSQGFGLRWLKDNEIKVSEDLFIAVGKEKVPLPRYYVEKLNLHPLLIKNESIERYKELNEELDKLYPGYSPELKHQLYRDHVVASALAIDQDDLRKLL